MPFTAHATPPTITMPRVKAMTTGSIPSFLDVILNFAESDTTSSLANQDTWLSQLKDKPEGKLVMYGDDTWLKLFPSVFARADGTSSFFVSVSRPSSGYVHRCCNTENQLIGFHGSGRQCNKACAFRDEAERLEWHDYTLSRTRPYWTQGGS